MKTRTYAGRMNSWVTFQTETRVSDGGGGYTIDWTDYASVWGRLMPERGRERVEAGRLESAITAILRIRYDTTSSEIDAGYRAVINGVPWVVRVVSNPDQNRDYLELVVEKGTAT